MEAEKKAGKLRAIGPVTEDAQRTMMEDLAVLAARVKRGEIRAMFIVYSECDGYKQRTAIGDFTEEEVVAAGYVLSQFGYEIWRDT